MGFSPAQVGEMSIFQFISAVDGYVAAHTPPDGPGKMSSKEADDLWEWMQGQG